MDMIYEISKLANDLCHGDAADLLDLIERVNTDSEIWDAIEQAVSSDGLEEMTERFEELLAGAQEFLAVCDQIEGFCEEVTELVE